MQLSRIKASVHFQCAFILKPNSRVVDFASQSSDLHVWIRIIPRPGDKLHSHWITFLMALQEKTKLRDFNRPSHISHL